MLSAVHLRIVMLCLYAECPYAECRFTECRHAECHVVYPYSYFTKHLKIEYFTQEIRLLMNFSLLLKNHYPVTI
jgi:hypothetical protein